VAGAFKKKEEDIMKLISSFELQQRTDHELAALFGQISQGLTRTERGSPARRNALGSLENISRARTARQMRLRMGL
jgi:hypothetical protein